MPEVKDIPEHVWEKLAFFRERILRGRQWVYEMWPTDERLEQLQAEHARVDALEARQRAFYKMYIDAGDVAIIGDADVHDEHFIQAHNAVLVMTSKHPELRDAINPYFCMILTWMLRQIPHRFVVYYDHDNPEHHENPFKEVITILSEIGYDAIEMMCGPEAHNMHKEKAQIAFNMMSHVLNALELR